MGHKHPEEKKKTWHWWGTGAVVIALGASMAFYFVEPEITDIKEVDAAHALVQEMQAEDVAPVAAPSVAETAADGKELFATNCASCHGVDGGGTSGPNLTDAYWIHGGDPEVIQAIVRDGVPGKGMAAWGPILGEPGVTAVVRYVISLQGSKPANPKAPEGEAATPVTGQAQ